MKIICHKNDNAGFIKNPVILIQTNDEDHLNFLLGSISDDLNPIVVDKSQLPNGKFFKAWKIENNKIEIDFEIAKSITKDRLRAERIPLFQEQDILFQRALETGASTVEIVAEKNRLRDITNLVDSAQTLQDLEIIKVGA